MTIVSERLNYRPRRTLSWVSVVRTLISRKVQRRCLVILPHPRGAEVKPNRLLAAREHGLQRDEEEESVPAGHKAPDDFTVSTFHLTMLQLLCPEQTQAPTMQVGLLHFATFNHLCSVRRPNTYPVIRQGRGKTAGGEP